MPLANLPTAQNSYLRHFTGSGTLTFDDISTLPKDLRQALIDAGFVVGLPEIAETFRSSDGTERYLVACADKQTVETVWMPGGDGGEEGDGIGRGRESAGNYLCFQPDRLRGELPVLPDGALGIAAESDGGGDCRAGGCRAETADARIGRDRINLVFMGMGEPFLNYDAFMDAVRLLVNEVGIAESRMTVSTSGIVPGIMRFGDEPVRPKLAISLNASNNTVREQVMPITRKWTINDVLEAVRSIPLRAKERVTFEYVLLGGVNDQREHADEVAALIRRANIPAKVNLIVWNPGPGVDFHMPLAEDVARFQSRLMLGGIPAFIRRPRGRDIYAACGQLKRTLSATS